MSREMGIGSSSHVFRAEFYTDLPTVFSDTGSKHVSGFPVKRLPKDGSEDRGPNSSRVFIILFKKKSEKIFRKSD